MPLPSSRSRSDVGAPARSGPRGARGWLSVGVFVVGLACPARAVATPVTLTRVPGTSALDLVGEIPIEGPFTVRHRVRETTRGAILHVWPRAVQPACDGDPPPYDAPQTHIVEMSVADEGEARWATAAVPHLQVDRAFCFRVGSIESMALPPLAGLGLVEARLAAQNIEDLPRWARSLANESLSAACEGAMRDSRDAGRTTCDPALWAPALERRLIATVLGSRILLARARRSTVADARDDASKILGGLLKRLDRLPAIPSQGLDAKAARRMSPDDATAARAALEASGQSPEWQAWLTEFADAVRRSDFETARVDEAERAVAEARAAVQPQLDAAIADFLSNDAYAERLSPAAIGSARTRSANNFVTPVYGVAIGLPSHGGDAWLFTYAGAHIFLEPVERGIPFDEMVGGQMGQRLSLFVGALTSDAGGIDRARVSPGLGAAYPGLGLGWRITQHLAMDAIAFLYTATDDDPLIDRQTLGATLAVGFTAELDIVQWLTPN